MAAFLGALAAQGKTLADAEEAVGIADDGSLLLALQVHGGDAAPLAPLFAAIISGAGPAPMRETIAGKDTWTSLPNEDKPLVRVYSSGDIIWAVQAVDPGLSEIFAFLP